MTIDYCDVTSPYLWTFAYRRWLFSGTLRSRASFQSSLEPGDDEVSSQVNIIDVPIALMKFESPGRTIKIASVTETHTHTNIQSERTVCWYTIPHVSLWLRCVVVAPLVSINEVNLR